MDSTIFLVDTERDGFDIDFFSLSMCVCLRLHRQFTVLMMPSAPSPATPSATHAPLKNVTIANCFVTGADELPTRLTAPGRSPPEVTVTVALNAAPNRTGGFRNIAISNCVLEGSKGIAIETGGRRFGRRYCNLKHHSSRYRRRAHLPALNHRNRARPKAARPGFLRRVLISNVVSYNSSFGRRQSFSGIPSNLIKDVKLTNCYFSNVQGCPQHSVPGPAPNLLLPEWDTIRVPENEDGYPDPNRFGPTPSKGFFIRHLKNSEMSHDIEIASALPLIHVFFQHFGWKMFIAPTFSLSTRRLRPLFRFVTSAIRIPLVTCAKDDDASSIGTIKSSRQNSLLS